ncbi:hypothetical protein [Prevotella sp. HUN102]|nr:hypothetical protein [Prevotella sp. HUN102]
MRDHGYKAESEPMDGQNTFFLISNYNGEERLKSFDDEETYL